MPTNKKQKKDRLRWFVVWLSNTTDSRDDEPTKVKAHNATEAGEIALQGKMERYTIGRTFDGLTEFFRFYPGWRGLL